jgi:hypothetical protein
MKKNDLYWTLFKGITVQIKHIEGNKYEYYDFITGKHVLNRVKSEVFKSKSEAKKYFK